MSAVSNQAVPTTNSKPEEIEAPKKWVQVLKQVLKVAAIIFGILGVLAGAALVISPFIAFPLASAGVISVGAYKLVCACWVALAPIGIGFILAGSCSSGMAFGRDS